MSTTTTPSPSSTSKPPLTFTQFKNTTSLALLVASPILLLLPPRKLDLYTFSLSTAFMLSLNEQSIQRTQRSLGQHLRLSAAKPIHSSSPQQAKDGTGVQPQASVDREQQDWIGSKERKGTAAQEDWKEQRLRAEREALAQGKGYGGLIMDQIWEVWNNSESDSTQKSSLSDKDSITKTQGQAQAVKKE